MDDSFPCAPDTNINWLMCTVRREKFLDGFVSDSSSGRPHAFINKDTSRRLKRSAKRSDARHSWRLRVRALAGLCWLVSAPFCIFGSILNGRNLLKDIAESLNQQAI